MDFDFAIILVGLTSLTGFIWLVDKLFFARQRAVKAAANFDDSLSASGEAVKQNDTGISDPIIVEYSKSFFPVLLLVLIVRSFLIEPFQIPSQSMMPTLQVGDFILVNKFSYGLRVPVLGYKFYEVDAPKRGDVMVFKTPEDNATNYIKRVIGVPGDKISYGDNILKINDEEVDLRLLADRPSGRLRERVYEETIETAKHQIIKFAGLDNGVTNEWQVPEGEYFMMGDNRDRSKDSRFIGTVPDRNIVGRAFAIWMHWDEFFSVPSFSRVGKIE